MAPSIYKCNKIGFPDIAVRNKVPSENIHAGTSFLKVIFKGT
jgi:hypothetical protein